MSTGNARKITHKAREEQCPGIDPSPLLLSSSLSSEQVRQLFSPYGIQNIAQADANLQAMAGNPEERRALANILSELLTAISETADPDQALNAWEHYVGSGIQRRSVFEFLSQAPRLLSLLCMIFGNSPALAETLIRDPMLVYWLAEERVDTRTPSRRQLEASVRESLNTFHTYEPKCDALRRFKRREMLRIGTRDLLRVADVTETVSSLSNLAMILIQASYELVNAKLNAHYGIPHHQNRRGQWVETGFVVMGMGKLGGGELNYSSDVDLVYLYEMGGGETRGTAELNGVSSEEYFEMLAREMTHVLNAATDEGSVFRVDLRLRPEGELGPLANSLDDSVHYYRTRGRDWERMAFIKSYPIAGNKPIGQKFLRRIRPFIWGKEDAPARDIIGSVQALKAKIQSKLIQRGEETRHVKLGVGGIREIEFLVQALQLMHVHQFPQVMERNTLKALAHLRDRRVLSAKSVTKLEHAYRFLRNVEHKLQMVDDLQTHVLPRQSQEIAKCAIRLGYPKGQSCKEATQRFLEDYRHHTSTVHRLYLQYIGEDA